MVIKQVRVNATCYPSSLSSSWTLQMFGAFLELSEALVIGVFEHESQHSYMCMLKAALHCANIMTDHFVNNGA